MSETSKETADLRRLAHAVYDLAKEAQQPEIIGEFLLLAGKILARAEGLEASDEAAGDGAKRPRRR